MAKRPKTKTEMLGIRVSPKIRYGLELLARKQQRTISEIVNFAIDAYLESDGIAKKSGHGFSNLDALWSEDRYYRLLNEIILSVPLSEAEKIVSSVLIKSGILTVTGNDFDHNEEIINLIKTQIEEGLSSEQAATKFSESLSAFLPLTYSGEKKWSDFSGFMKP